MSLKKNETTIEKILAVFGNQRPKPSMRSLSFRDRVRFGARVATSVATILLLNGCASLFWPSPKMEDEFRTLISIEDMNRSITLEFDSPQQSEFELGSLNTLRIFNNSSQSVLIHYSKDIHLYTIMAGKWIEIANEVEFIGNVSELTLTPQGTDLFRDVSTIPFSTRFSQGETVDGKIPIRLVVMGLLNAELSEEPTSVAAFMDIFLSP